MDRNNIPIITLGVSINGIEALKLYFKQVKQDSGYSYVIIQDIGESPQSLINDLLEAKFNYPIQIIKHGMSLESNRIYVNPPGKFYILSSNRFQLQEVLKNKPLSRLLSSFFESLAEDKNEGSAVILLSEPQYVEPVKNNIAEPTKKIFFENEYYKLSSIAKQTRNTIIITNLQGEITYVNNSFLKLTGYDEKFVLGKKPGDFLQGKDTNPKTIEIMSESLSKKEGFEVDIINYTKSGKKYWTNINCEPLLDRNNRIKGFFSIQYEISCQKEYEKQVKNLNYVLNSRNKKLTELNKSLEEFAYIASHDLKEPARNIKSVLELTLRKSEGQLDETLLKYIKMAVSAGDKMNQLIDSLLEFSRSGILNEDLVTINLRDAFKELEFSLSPLIEEHDAEILLKDNIGDFQAYPILFRRLLQNLIQNAIKYRSDIRPKIVITANENEFYYIFSVSDNGIGISENNFERIFKVFQKVHNKDSKSHGIGLAVCKKIVETHFGQIDIESQVGHGSTFHFTISKKL